MPTDAPTPSGAMLVWEPTGPGDIGDRKATTPFFGMYRLYERADGKWYAYLLGHAGSLLIAGGSNVEFRDEAAARAACEADCRERMAAAGWVPAGDALRRPEAIGVMAALAAAISLLERSPKSAAPSDKMFDLMLTDYRRALDNARRALATPGGQHDD